MGRERGNDRSDGNDRVAASLVADGTWSLPAALDRFLTLGDGSHLEFLDELLRILLHRVMDAMGTAVFTLIESAVVEGFASGRTSESG